MAAIGDTFLLVNSRINEHCFVVISDPRKNPDQIVTVNFTSYDVKKDQSCIVERDEHPFVKHRTCIYYRNNLLRLVNYNRFLASGDIVPHAPVDQTLLRRILDGAAVSSFIPLENRKILVEQGLISDEW